MSRKLVKEEHFSFVRLEKVKLIAWCQVAYMVINYISNLLPKTYFQYAFF